MKVNLSFPAGKIEMNTIAVFSFDVVNVTSRTIAERVRLIVSVVQIPRGYFAYIVTSPDAG